MRKIRRSDGCQPIVRCADRFTAAYRLSAISGLVASPANVGTKNAGREVRFGIVGLFHSYTESCQIPHRLDLHDRLEEVWGNALTHSAGAFRSGSSGTLAQASVGILTAWTRMTARLFVRAAA